MSRFSGAVVVVACVMGCSAADVPHVEPSASLSTPRAGSDDGAAANPGAEGDSRDPWQACSADADCTVIEVGCCDHCNGGSVLSVAKGSAAAALSAYKQTDCGGACTERGCAAAEPICVQGTCGYRAGWIIDQATQQPKVIATPLPQRP